MVPPDNNLLKVLVHPGAAKDEIIDFRDGCLRLRVKARPEKGEANKACQKILAEGLRIAPQMVKIVKGEKSRHKLIKILAENPSWERLNKTK